MYGALIRFYNTTLKLSVLEQMKEDFIELITKMVFNEQMSNIVLALCRMCTKDEERIFAMKLQEFSDVTTQVIGLPEEFTLSEASKIKQKFEK
jgi:hypothetical protein